MHRALKASCGTRRLESAAGSAHHEVDHLGPNPQPGAAVGQLVVRAVRVDLRRGTIRGRQTLVVGSSQKAEGWRSAAARPPCGLQPLPAELLHARPADCTHPCMHTCPAQHHPPTHLQAQHAAVKVEGALQRGAQQRHVVHALEDDAAWGAGGRAGRGPGCSPGSGTAPQQTYPARAGDPPARAGHPQAPMPAADTRAQAAHSGHCILAAAPPPQMAGTPSRRITKKSAHPWPGSARTP